jgi:hypothetical protein
MCYKFLKQTYLLFKQASGTSTDETKNFNTFVKAIFYVGKGKGNRLFVHAKEAKKPSKKLRYSHYGHLQ